jgi:long-chain fatty acid transport protein
MDEPCLTNCQDIRAALSDDATTRHLAKTCEAACGAPYSDVNGGDTAINFHVGVLYELSDRTQFGPAAQTGADFELKGSVEIKGFPKQQTPDVFVSATLTADGFSRVLVRGR